MKTFSMCIFEQSLFKWLSFALVSIRKSMDREYFFTNSVSSRIACGFPNPQQFQLKQFIGFGGAAQQPPPLQSNHYEQPGLFVVVWKGNLVRMSIGVFQQRGVQILEFFELDQPHIFCKSKQAKLENLLLSLKPQLTFQGRAG